MQEQKMNKQRHAERAVAVRHVSKTAVDNEDPMLYTCKLEPLPLLSVHVRTIVTATTVDLYVSI